MRQSRVQGTPIGEEPAGTFTRQSRWILAPCEELNVGAISWSKVCGSECVARLLLRKGFHSLEEVENFLRPRLSLLSDPFLLPQMHAAVSRIFDALDRRESIVLFGDYDVDGVTSLALLSEMLCAYGGTPELFLPLRREEGYGLSRESIERCLEQHQPQLRAQLASTRKPSVLLIAVDCGSSSVNEVAALNERGVDVIVLDHHETTTQLPDCVAIVNPKIAREADNPVCLPEADTMSNSRRQDCLRHSTAPFEYLCSVGIVFKLCHALLKTRPLPGFDLKSKLDLVALGTVADIVPLRDENRALVKRGAIAIAQTSRIGLRKLMQVAGLHAPILPDDIGYRLGPRLNAAGRLSTAEKSLRLLLTHDESEAAALAAELDQHNRERQEVEHQIL